MWPFNRNSQNRGLNIETFLHSLFDSLTKARKEFPDSQLFDEKAKNVLRTLIVALLTGAVEIGLLTDEPAKRSDGTSNPSDQTVQDFLRNIYHDYSMLNR